MPGTKRKRSVTRSGTICTVLVFVIAIFFTTGTLCPFFELAASGGNAAKLIISSTSSSTAGGTLLQLDGSRLAVALARRSCPASWSNYTDSVAIMHIPKTAGTFLSGQFAVHMSSEGPGRFCLPEDLPLAFEDCSSTLRHGQTEFLSNVLTQFPSNCSGMHTHFDMSLFDMLGVDYFSTLTVVLMRHPVDRAISNYMYTLKVGSDLRSKCLGSPTGSIAGLLRFSATPVVIANRATYQLAGAMRCRYTASRFPYQQSEADVLALAMRNLERFCLLLIQERWQESMERLIAATGFSPDVVFNSDLEVVQRNARTAAEQLDVPDWVRQELEQYNHLDMQLYNYSLWLFQHTQF